jgi:FAD/FMN-containing dehydrogenase
MRLKKFILLIGFAFVGRTEAADECKPLLEANQAKSFYHLNTVMDVSRTASARTFTATPTSKEDVIEAIAFARRTHLKLTIMGTNHTHGGHNRRHETPNGKPQAIQLNMMSFNKILSLDLSKQEVTVQAGVTWRELSIFLNPAGLAARTEQSSNIFSIGGSVSANIHGRDIHGPLINSIVEIKFIDSQGVEQIVSRFRQPDVFRAVVGGYGGMGVITEITLKLEKNDLYKAHAVKDISIDEYISYIHTLSRRPDNRMHYGRVNISGKHAFNKMSFVEWAPVPDQVLSPERPEWALNLGEKHRWASSQIMNLMRHKPTSRAGKYIKDIMDKYFGLPKTGTLKTKNNIHNNPVQFLFDNFYNQQNSVDILQEYFIPVDQLKTFLQSLNSILAAQQSTMKDVTLMNATMRFVPKLKTERDSFLSPYSAENDLVAVVLYFNVQELGNPKNGDLVNYDGSEWTRKLIHSAQSLGGSFYWPYHRWWTADQIRHQKNDRIIEYFKIKERLDPENIFESDFLHHLRRALLLSSGKATHNESGPQISE